MNAPLMLPGEVSVETSADLKVEGLNRMIKVDLLSVMSLFEH